MLGQQWQESGTQNLDRTFAQPLQQAVAGAIAPIAEWARELSEHLSHQLAEPVRQMLTSVDSAVQTLGPVFSEAGFWLTPSMPIDMLREIKRLENQGMLTPERVKQVILERYRKHNCALLQEMVDHWRTNPLFAPRMHIFQDALDAHIAGKYTLSIPALLPQVEGIASQVVGRFPGKSQEVIRQAVGESHHKIFATVAEEALLLYITEVAYARVDFSQFTRWLEQKELAEEQVLHRHAILHGVQINYDSEENSLRAFLLLDALFRLKALRE